MQEPTEIRIGDPYYANQFTGSRTRLKERYDTFQYVPLEDTLQKLLKDDTILEQIEKSRIRSDGLIEDYCDGSIFREHPLFSEDPHALQIIAYWKCAIL